MIVIHSCLRTAIFVVLQAFAAVGYSQADNKGIQYLDQSWMTAKWTEDDKEFVAVRKDIERVSSDKKHLGRIVENVLTRVAERKATSMDLFRWSTAMIILSATFDEWRSLDGNRKWKAPYDLFTKFSVPGSFEFTRIRFLFTARFDFPHHNLVEIGEKLVTRSPDDPVLGRMLLKLYQPQAFPEDRSKGERLVQRLERMSSETVARLTVVSDFYHRCWMKSKSPEDARMAIQRSEKALKLTKSSEQAQNIRNTISAIRSGG